MGETPRMHPENEETIGRLRGEVRKYGMSKKAKEEGHIPYPEADAEETEDTEDVEAEGDQPKNA